MNYKPSENDLMAYLYGELEGAEKEAFDKYLFDHPETRLELERLQQMRRRTEGEPAEIVLVHARTRARQ